MKENFDKALLHILKYEGKFSNIKSDRGGATNQGITLRTLQQYYKETGWGDLDKDGDIDINDIILLDTPEEAAPIYKKFFWDVMKLDDFPKGVDFLMFDFGVNSGPKNAKIILQKALNGLGAELVEDGIIGSKTMKAIKSISQDTLIRAMLNERDIFYRKIVAQNKSQEIFLKGWLNRIGRLTLDVHDFVRKED